MADSNKSVDISEITKDIIELKKNLIKVCQHYNVPEPTDLIKEAEKYEYNSRTTADRRCSA